MSLSSKMMINSSSLLRNCSGRIKNFGGKNYLNVIVIALYSVLTILFTYPLFLFQMHDQGSEMSISTFGMFGGLRKSTEFIKSILDTVSFSP